MHGPESLPRPGPCVVPVDANLAAPSLQLKVTGPIDIRPLDNPLDVSGLLHFDIKTNTDGSTPETYGAFVFESRGVVVPGPRDAVTLSVPW